jgi:hypothetical protein
MTTYISESWRRVMSKDAEFRLQHPEFAVLLRAAARPIQIAYQKLMSFSNGNPVGIECTSRNRDSWAFILPEVSQSSEYQFRIQSFDQDGFLGHFCYASLEAAINALLSDGYRIIDAGALDRLASTQRWSQGVKRQEIRTIFNSGLISMTEMAKRFADLQNT